MKTTEIIKLSGLKHKNNYKNLVKDKIKELKAIDQKKINKLIKDGWNIKKSLTKVIPKLR